MADIHSYEPRNGHGLKHDPFNAIVAPRPIGWISSRGRDGALNLAPYSFFNAFGYVPPIVGFAATSKKDTIRNLEDTGEFVWNLVSRDLAEQMNATAAHVARDVDEFALANVTPQPSTLVSVPRVGESRVAFECRLTQLIALQDLRGEPTGGWLALGEVVAVHIDRGLILDGVYQTALGEPLLRAGRRGDYFTVRTQDMFEMCRPE